MLGSLGAQVAVHVLRVWHPAWGGSLVVSALGWSALLLAFQQTFRAQRLERGWRAMQAAAAEGG